MVNTKTALVGIFISLILATATTFLGGIGQGLFLNAPIFYWVSFAIFVLHILIFIPSYFYQTEHYFDLTGSLAFLLSMGLAVGLAESIAWQHVLFAAPICAWTLRLGSYLVLRIKKYGKDDRFDVMKTKFWWFLMTWCFSALWVLISAAPALAAMNSSNTVTIGLLQLFGLGLWIFGFSIECTADFQKSRFKAQSKNKGKFIHSGLWAVSRHPNYVGEVLLWLGLAFAAAPYLQPIQYPLLASPLLIYILLRFISGVNLLETKADIKWGKQGDYLAYKKNTPIFWPFLK